MTILDHFHAMDWGPAPESPDAALQWIASRGGTIGPFIDGACAQAHGDEAFDSYMRGASWDELLGTGDPRYAPAEAAQ